MENKDFAERNVGLVRALVPRFLGRGIEYDDLFQAGCEGLIKAAAQPVSLTGDDENNETDIPVDAPEEKITDHLALQQILKALPEEDQRLIYYRYFKNQTQTETAKRLGTTQVQISRREKKLLLRLRGLLL